MTKENVFNANGKCIDYHYESDTVKSEYNRVNGIIHGGFVGYDSSGERNINATYENGLRIGKYVGYECDYKYREIATIANYELGRRHGKYIRKYNDIIIEEGEYHHGRENGKFIFRYHSGNIRNEISYIYGKRHGTELMFRENGSRFYEYNHEYGRNMGKLIDYYDNKTNSKRIELIIEPNKKYKYLKYYHKNGKVKQEGHYYHETFDPNETMITHKRRYVGVWKFYDVKGKMLSIEIHSVDYNTSSWLGSLENHNNKTIVECYKNKDYDTVKALLDIEQQSGSPEFGWYKGHNLSADEIEKINKKFNIDNVVTER